MPNGVEAGAAWPKGAKCHGDLPYRWVKAPGEMVKGERKKMKNVKMFGKSIPLIAIVLVGLLTIGASAALLTYYVSITATATVSQSVVFDDDSTSATDVFDIIAGSTECSPYTLKNRAEVDAQVFLQTSYSPDGVGITTSYYTPIDYEYSATINNVEVEVADDGEWLTWTYTYADEPTHTPKMTVAIDYPNGFSITTFDDGSHDGWYYAPDVGVEVKFAEYIGGTYEDWVETSAIDSVLTVSIKKSALGCVESFLWHGYANYDGSQVWINSGETGSGYEVPQFVATLLEPLTAPFWVSAESKMGFLVCYEFDVALIPNTYTITTLVVPSP